MAKAVEWEELCYARDGAPCPRCGGGWVTHKKVTGSGREVVAHCEPAILRRAGLASNHRNESSENGSRHTPNVLTDEEVQQLLTSLGGQDTLAEDKAKALIGLHPYLSHWQPCNVLFNRALGVANNAIDQNLGDGSQDWQTARSVWKELLTTTRQGYLNFLIGVAGVEPRQPRADPYSKQAIVARIKQREEKLRAAGFKSGIDIERLEEWARR